jgi:hypothetical protein
MSIITLSQQQAIKQISPNWANTAKLTGGVTNFDQLSNEVENKELNTLLGLEFYQWILANFTDANVLLLLNGTTYTNNAGNSITFKGLLYVLAYLNFSEYVVESHISDTFTGMKKKNTAESEHLSLGEIKNIQNRNRGIALQEFEVIKDYLDVNYLTYTLWKPCKSNKISKPYIYGIKKTIY